MVFVIGVSSGIFGAAAPEEREQYAGLYKKAQYCITKGVQFVQVDLESVAEFKDPNLKENMERIKRLGVSFGIHSETRAFGVEIAELDSAIETDYKFGHERLREILERSGEIGSKYVLIHSSESEPFLLLERHLQPAVLVDFFGNRLRDFLEQYDWLIDWAIGGKVEDIEECMFNVWMAKGKRITSQDMENALKEKGLKPQNFLWIEIIGAPLSEIVRRRMEDRAEAMEIELGMDYDVMPPDLKRRVDEQIRRTLSILLKDIKTSLLDYTQSRTLHYGPERIAYYFVARWMEKKSDPLWENIIKSTLGYFAKVENKSIEQWLGEKKIEKLSIEDDNFRLHSYIWVPAVSAKYIWGHLNQEKNPKKLYPDLKPIIKKYNMPLVLETPMAHRGIEEWLRLPNPIQMYYLVKEIGPEYIRLALDFEHMISIRLDPEKVIDALPEDAGKYVLVIHAGWPAPLAPAHIPIYVGSEQQFYLYKMYYKLMQKGFGKGESEYYIVFERGGGVDPIKTSVTALQNIRDFLEKNVPPEELIKHPEFFEREGEWERQLVTIEEHARDPLKGLLVVPEEEYTALGRAATERGVPPEKWKKEELR